MNKNSPQTASKPGIAPSSETRRQFIRKAATLAAVASAGNVFKSPVYGQTQAPSAGSVLGANDRIRVAYVGVGKQGMAHVNLQKRYAKENNISQVAVCDLYQKRLAKAREFLSLKDADGYGDHRRLLERKDVDAVVIATVDNWHAQVSIDALQAGKHVFCEKPMTRYFAEAFDVYDAVKGTGKTYVVGSQGCMDPKWHKAAEWIRAGKLGPLAWGQTSYCRNNKDNSEWTYPVEPDATEQNLDWNRWLGKAPKIPFNPEHFFCWHKYYAYNSGILGNLLPHRVHPMMLATGNLEFPRRVVATGTRKISTDRDITDTTHLLAEFPSGLTLVAAGSTVNEQGLPEIIRGHKGTVYLTSSQNRAELRPEAIFSEDIDPESFSDPQPPERIEVLEKNFFDCIRSGKMPVANIELAIRTQAVLCLAEMSERMGLALFFDEKTRTVHTGDGRKLKPLTYDTIIPQNV
jgi:predicted dehydrogenase